MSYAGEDVVAADRGAAARLDQCTLVGAIFKEIHALAVVHELNSGSHPRYNDLISPVVHSRGDEPAGSHQRSSLYAKVQMYVEEHQMRLMQRTYHTWLCI
ncbi:hypothetical protein TRIUR3_01784 [Triticum urartu]|uniref:Uncharacterized protein n=1 Tax=Triticum urartu TaxID=4572 RepID=M8A3A4_TRIUA|nr:hypothetical protein TRIUR3_01784 [Triticum urartu]